jgi:hypothetical protein
VETRETDWVIDSPHGEPCPRLAAHQSNGCAGYEVHSFLTAVTRICEEKRRIGKQLAFGSAHTRTVNALARRRRRFRARTLISTVQLVFFGETERCLGQPIS